MITILTITLTLCITTLSTCMELKLKQPNKTLISDMSHHARQLLYNNSGFSPDKLTEFIEAFNAAKHIGITEDLVGAHNLTTVSTMPLFFSFLKRYNTIIETKSEHVFAQEPFAKELSITLPMNKETHIFNELTQQILALRQQDSIDWSNCAFFIYSPQKALQSDYSTKALISNWQETFLYHAHHLFAYASIGETYPHKTSPYKMLCFLIAILEQKNIKTERDLYAIAPHYNANAYSWKDNQSLKIRMLCYFIAEYNKNSRSKKHPTYAQINCYTIMKSFPFALPDSFDTGLLDNKRFALEELIELNNRNILLCTTKDTVTEACINELIRNPQHAKL